MLTGLGMAHVQLEEYEKGLEVWRMAATLDVNNAQVRYYMGRIILDHLLDGAVALVAADAALDLRPDYVDALLLRGEALASLGRKDEALAAYRRAQNMAPKDERIDHLVNALKR
jgi:tetratricopeptide (TPR) repeat protein